MVTSGAAPLIVCAFRRVRRSTSTGTFQTCDAGRAGVHLPLEAVHQTRPSDVLTRIKRERVPCQNRAGGIRTHGLHVPNVAL